MILKKSDCSGKQSSMDGGGGMGSGIGLDILRLTLCPSYFVGLSYWELPVLLPDYQASPDSRHASD